MRDTLFMMPRSPFEEEKEKLGWGFLKNEDYPLGSPNPKHYRITRKLLTPDQRRYIGATDRTTPARDLAERFGIEVSYVHRLRANYRKPKPRRPYL